MKRNLSILLLSIYTFSLTGLLVQQFCCDDFLPRINQEYSHSQMLSCCVDDMCYGDQVPQEDDCDDPIYDWQIIGERLFENNQLLSLQSFYHLDFTFLKTDKLLRKPVEQDNLRPLYSAPPNNPTKTSLHKLYMRFTYYG